MSLLLHKRAIARAVLGELDAAAEGRLRAHLRGCAACRGHYDRLAGAALAAGGGAGAAARERARLFAALDAPAAPAANAPAAGLERQGAPWLGIGLVLAPVVALVLWFTVRPPTPDIAEDDGITLRGSPAPARAAATAVVLYASRKTGPDSHGPVRLVGELPGSGEARVSLGDYLQLGVRGLRGRMHVRVVGVDEAGVVHDYVPDTVVDPGPAPLTLGRSLELARDHRPGRLRVVALLSSSKVEEQTVRDAISRLDPRRADPAADAYQGVVTGLVVIEP